MTGLDLTPPFPSNSTRSLVPDGWFDHRGVRDFFQGVREEFQRDDVPSQAAPRPPASGAAGSKLRYGLRLRTRDEMSGTDVG